MGGILIKPHLIYLKILRLKEIAHINFEWDLLVSHSFGGDNYKIWIYWSRKSRLFLRKISKGKQYRHKWVL